MKRLQMVLLCGVLLGTLWSCGRVPPVDTAPESDTTTGDSSNMNGGQNGNDPGGKDTAETNVGMPMPENGGHGGLMGGMDGDSQLNAEETTPPDPVDSVASADDAMRFITGNLYPLCGDVLPMAVETRTLDLSDTDAIQYNTGLTATGGITDIVISESAIGSFAYSLVYVRTDGSNTDAVHQSLRDSINPRKWVCAEAEAMNTIRLDNDICLVMGSTEQVDTISSSLKEAAEGVFDSVGEFTNVL